MRLALSKMKTVRGHPSTAPDEDINWSKPPVGWVKINVDGSTKFGEGRARVGCVARDHKGVSLVGEARSADLASSAITELMAIYARLNLAWKNGFMKIILESDSREAINYVLG